MFLSYTTVPRSPPHMPSPPQSYGRMTASIICVSSFCRRLELRGFSYGLPHINAPNIEEMCLVAFDSHRLSSTLVNQIAAMTSLRSLQLQDWDWWEDVKPLAALPLLTRLTCAHGVRLMADILQPGCLQSLEVASIAHMTLLCVLLPQLSIYILSQFHSA